MLRSLSSRSAFRAALAALILGVGTMVAVDFAEARVSRGGSIGSRGSRTWSTPAPTPTSPTAQPMQRSATPSTGPQNPAGVTAPATAAGAARGGFFSRPGFMGGLMGGLLGAGLFGLLMGGGFFSGLGSLAGLLGLLLQAVLIFFVVRLVMGWLRNHNSQPAYAGGPRPDAMARDEVRPETGPVAAGGGSGLPRFGFDTGPRGKPLKLAGADFDMFESLLGEVQAAYGRDDRRALDRLLTPEMAGYIGEELDDMERRGLENRLSDIKLLQGDLSEAWTEDGRDYATVAMRYALKDAMVERSSGRVVEGDADTLTQATELWTFVRPAGGGEWKVSAIQQS
ncbi:TIM44-like domain-containing protein [Ancylobacter lacus]|uniref:TIM44-like domain-containing protein n=1 Tax=Ancylobacter lacus TaxID=2579970 RepID=UPI001BCA9D00|nr:TIM44-like domain-containing protein [Ancylobacter lacus]MBS7538291.1 TIM44-like domain-containing protein [Ancylobacter lacus]